MNAVDAQILEEIRARNLHLDYISANKGEFANWELAYNSTFVLQKMHGDIPWLINRIEVLEQASRANVEAELAAGLAYFEEQLDTLRKAVGSFADQCRREMRNGFDFYDGFLEQLVEMEELA